VKALLDELPPAIAEQLRNRGHDVIAVAERAELRGRPDREVFVAAQAQDRVVVTRDRADYLEIDRAYRAAGQHHAGLVLVPSSIDLAAVGPLVTALDVVLATDPPWPGFVHWL
jgi:hypothetical protein